MLNTKLKNLLSKQLPLANLNYNFLLREVQNCYTQVRK